MGLNFDDLKGNKRPQIKLAKIQWRSLLITNTFGWSWVKVLVTWPCMRYDIVAWLGHRSANLNFLFFRNQRFGEILPVAVPVVRYVLVREMFLSISKFHLLLFYARFKDILWVLGITAPPRGVKRLFSVLLFWHWNKLDILWKTILFLA